MSRYAEPRQHLRWNKNNRLQVLKMLAFLIYNREYVRGAKALEARVDAVCESVMKTILGEDGVTLRVIQEHTLEEQGAPITAAKLLQRADKTERYGEFNAFHDAVGAAHAELRRVHKGPPQNNLDESLVSEAPSPLHLE